MPPGYQETHSFLSDGLLEEDMARPTSIAARQIRTMHLFSHLLYAVETWTPRSEHVRILEVST